MKQAVACIDGQANAALLELQQRQKRILAEVLGFCAAHEIPCILAAGSALGAARHGDIIPWDDDIDMAMMRGDLTRFEDLWLREYRGPLSLHSPRTERAYPLDYIKIREPGTAMNEPELDGSGLVDGIYIDIFAMDILPNSRLLRRVQHGILAALNLVIMSYSRHTTKVSGSRLIRVSRRLSHGLRWVLPWRKLIGLREWISSAADTAGERELVCFEMYGIGKASKTIISREKLFPPATLPFGALDAPVPRDIEAYLTGIFGDWRKLPPPEQRQPPHARQVDFGE